jgi:hypothetical protein
MLAKLFQLMLFATIDVVGLYTNIPVDEGIDAVREALEERQMLPQSSL